MINLKKLKNINSEKSFSTLLLTIIIPIASKAVGTAAPDNIFNILSGIFPKLNSKIDNNNPIKQEIITGFFDIDFKAIIKDLKSL